MVALFISGLGFTLLTMDVWIDDRHWPFSPMQVQGDLASLFSSSSVPLSSVGSVLCGCSGCEWALPESVTGMLATSGPGYIKPYWCASKMLPKLADDANSAKAVGGDRCYLSSPAPSSQIVASNKAINLIDQHINFTATFMLQLGGQFSVLKTTHWGLLHFCLTGWRSCVRKQDPVPPQRDSFCFFFPWLLEI